MKVWRRCWVATLRNGNIPSWGNGHEFVVPVFYSRSEARRWRKRGAPSTVIRRATLTIDEPKKARKT
jgi:hypothetical protein